MRKFPTLTILAAAFGLFAGMARATTASPALQAKLDAQFAIIETWAADPVIVQAVREQNAAAPGRVATFDQEKWAALNLIDPQVRGFMSNPVGLLLRTHRSAVYCEAFVSAADGHKVGFMSKPTSWSHHGKPKHELPMEGKRWQGAVEVDSSTGMHQIQIAVPILDDGKPIGSLVVGLSARALAQ